MEYSLGRYQNENRVIDQTGLAVGGKRVKRLIVQFSITLCKSFE